MTKTMTAPKGKTTGTARTKATAKPAARRNDPAPVAVKAPAKGAVKALVTNPKSLTDRLIARRQELDLSQAQVAALITFWNKKQQEWKPLSRSAYCMYEAGDVVPDKDKIERLAIALQSTPEWLMFGIGARTTLDEIEWDAKAGDFNTTRSWPMDEDWLRAQFDCPGKALALVMVNDFSYNLKPGDTAFVRKDIVMPNAAGGEFVFVQDGEMRAAHVTRPTGAGPVRIYDAERREHIDVEADDLTFLGKVVGLMGNINRVEREPVQPEAVETGPLMAAKGVDVIEYTGADFKTTERWDIPADWFAERYSVSVEALALVRVTDFTASLNPGDMAFVQKGVTPTVAGGEFVLVHDGVMKIAHVTRPNASAPYRLYDTDRRHHEDVFADAVQFLGKVVGKMGDL